MFAKYHAIAAVLALGSMHAATLRHHYPFDSGAGDSVGDATLAAHGDSVVFNAAGGAAAGFVSLGGTDDYLSASLDEGSPLAILGDYSTFRPFSVSFWVRQNAIQTTSTTRAVFGLTTSSTDPGTFNTGFEVITSESSGSHALRVRARQGGAGSNQGEINTGLDVSDGEWHHVAVVYKALSRSVYVDGVFRGENTMPVKITTNPIRHFTLGAFLRAGDALDDFIGDVDDLQIYQGALTGTEAGWLFRNPGVPLGSGRDVAESQRTSNDPVDLVDPLIGAEGRGYCEPGPCLPHSSIYPSPNVLEVSPSGYKAGGEVVGFAQLHAQGAGPSTPSFGNFLVSPQIGPGINEQDHASPVSNVSAHPYAYRARLTRWKTDCTVAPAAHSALYQFDFPASADARICFDVARKLGRPDGMTDGTVTIDPKSGTISGGGCFDGNWNPASYHVYFYAKANIRPISGGTWTGDTASEGRFTASTRTRQRLGAWMCFNTTASQTVMLKIAISFVSVNQARAFLENEIPAWDIKELEANARQRWNGALSAVRAPGIPPDEGETLHRLVSQSRATSGPLG